MFSLPVDYRLKREQGLTASAIGMSLDIQSPFLMGNLTLDLVIEEKEVAS